MCQLVRARVLFRFTSGVDLGAGSQVITQGAKLKFPETVTNVCIVFLFLFLLARKEKAKISEVWRVRRL